MIEAYGPYVPVLLISMVATGMASVILLLNYVLGPKRPTAVKGIPYESGVDPIARPRQRFSIQFYMTAILFLIFDLEVVFLYPWAVVYKEMLAKNAPLIFGSMISFLGILFVGYTYAIKKKAFDWKN